MATELQGVSVLGYISVEKEATARRVVESHYPGVLHCDDVAAVQDEDVRGWSLKLSQAALVLIGAGPPCQGVSGLNADRKGALRDARSCLYVHVSRITQLVKGHFRWCQVHTLMESVSSMDHVDRDHMSRDFGEQPVHIDAGTLLGVTGRACIGALGSLLRGKVQLLTRRRQSMYDAFCEAGASRGLGGRLGQSGSDHIFPYLCNLQAVINSR